MKSLFRFFESRIYPFPKQTIDLPSVGVFKFVWACTQGIRGWLLLFLVILAATGAFQAMLFVWVGDLVDLLSTHTPETLWAENKDKLLWMGAILLLSPLLLGSESLIHHQVIQGVFPMKLRWRFHRRMLGQSMQFYQDEFSGRVSSKVMQTALAVRDTLFSASEIVIFLGVYLLTIGVVLIQLDWRLLLPFIAWLVLVTIALWILLPKMKEASSNQADSRALMTGRITDAYANIMTVKLFSHSKRELGYAKSAMTQFLEAVHIQMRLVTVLEIVKQTISVVLIGGSALISLYLWREDTVTVGTIATATALAVRLSGLTHFIMWQTTMMFEHVGTIQDGMRTLTAPRTIVDKANAKELVITQGKIAFDHVDFGYESSAKAQKALSLMAAKKTPSKKEAFLKNAPVETPDVKQYIKLLDNFNLEINAGEKIGLVGRSGAGKSTLVNLLLRFYDVDAGKILIDDQAIDEVTQESLRQQIGMVTQDTSLLHRTVRENISYGRPDATDEEIIEACKQAQAWEFIADLHDAKGRTGLDTQVGERGVKLSGGQRQRIAIARVMLKNAPILLLDEATSALDSEVEHAITQSLHAMMEGKTVIAIAHRLSTIAELDRLVVMDKGRIIELGSHEELLAQNGVYAGLWQRQSGGFLGEEE